MREHTEAKRGQSVGDIPRLNVARLYIQPTRKLLSSQTSKQFVEPVDRCVKQSLAKKLSRPHFVAVGSSQPLTPIKDVLDRSEELRRPDGCKVGP